MKRNKTIVILLKVLYKFVRRLYVQETNRLTKDDKAM